VARPSSKAAAEGRTIVCIDEAGFYLLPFVARTYAPCGQTPVLRAPLTHDHLSVISAVTPAGRLLTHIQEAAYCGPDIVAFLGQVQRQIPGKLLVLWDGASIHHGQAVKDYLAGGAAARLQLERLPGYAPELNPDEGAWNQLKRVELKNLCCQSVSELRRELRLAIRRVQRRPHVITACFQECGYV
jgi:transposase